MISNLPETLVAAIEHIVKRYAQKYIAQPLMGTITFVNNENNTCSFKPYGSLPEYKGVPLTIRPRNADKEPMRGFAIRPRVDSQAIVNFINGSWELPYVAWFEDVQAILIYGDDGVYIKSRGFISIDAKAGVSIMGRPVTPSAEPI